MENLKGIQELGKYLSKQPTTLFFIFSLLDVSRGFLQSINTIISLCPQSWVFINLADNSTKTKH